MLNLYDCCLRLEASLPNVKYHEGKSEGADAEVKTFEELGKPIFFSIDALYEWVDGCHDD